MKRIISILLAILMASSSLYAFTYAYAETSSYRDVVAGDDEDDEDPNSGKLGSNIKYVIKDGVVTLSLIDISDSSTNTYDYNGESKSPLWARTDIKSVVVEEGITKIGSYLFASLTGITSVDLADSVTTIGEFAFSGCSNLESFDVAKGLTTVEGSVFSSCPKITFNVDKDNTSFALGESSEYGDIGVLYHLNSERKFDAIVKYPASKSNTVFDLRNADSSKYAITKMYTYAFDGANNLSQIHLPSTLKNIAGHAFDGCSRILYIAIPESTSDVDPVAFSLASSLTLITVRDGNTSFITKNGVLYTSDRETLVVYPRDKDDEYYEAPGTIKQVYGYAFANASHLKGIYLPKSVISIAEKAFIGCSSLETLYIMNKDCALFDTHDVGDLCPEQTTLYAHEGSTTQAFATKYSRNFVATESNTYDFDWNDDYTSCTLTIRCEYCSNVKGPYQCIVRHYTREAYCNVDGYVEDVATCQVDGENYYDSHRVTIPGLSHDYKAVVVAPTCTEKGYTEYTCQRSTCNSTYRDSYVDALGHTPSATYSKFSDDKTSYYVKCATCKSTIVAVDYYSTDENNVIKEEKIVQKATCEKGEYTSYKYTVIYNGSEFATQTTIPTQTGPVAPHDYIIEKTWVDGENGEEPKIDIAVQCKNCGHIEEYENFDEKNLEVSKTTTATCTKDGEVTYSVSATTTDGQTITDYKTYPDLAKGHSPSEYVKEGYVKETCTSNGSYSNVKRCTVCGEILEKNSVVINATGHKWNSGTVSLQPTTTSTGVKAYLCTVCGEKKTVSIPKLTLSQATPSDTQANKAKVNTNIKKISKIRTTSYSSKKQMKITFSAITGAQNYRIAYRKAGAKTWTYKWTSAKTTYYLKNLKSRGLYEFKFAAYKKNANGVWERGEYSTTSYRYYYKASLKSVTAGKNSVKVTWNKDKSATGYRIQYSTNKDMSGAKTITVGAKATSKTITKLKKGKTYYVRVRALKKYNKKTYQGEYSAKKYAKVK